MYKQKVNDMIPIANMVLKNRYEDGKFPNELKGYISTFGAAITMGSLISAVAFYSTNGSSNNRSVLLKILQDVLKKYNKNMDGNLFEWVVKSEKSESYTSYELKEDILSATIAVKLALNLFIADK